MAIQLTNYVSKYGDTISSSYWKLKNLNTRMTYNDDEGTDTFCLIARYVMFSSASNSTSSKSTMDEHLFSFTNITGLDVDNEAGLESFTDVYCIANDSFFSGGTEV